MTITSKVVYFGAIVSVPKGVGQAVFIESQDIIGVVNEDGEVIDYLQGHINRVEKYVTLESRINILCWGWRYYYGEYREND